mmetsp:Transcript_151288/g.367456  ORF Transcript_151288/g.367456 Transcript_151288/m.367456 type:complete len:343 (+) Transcript_151288:493-1521(+)
MLREPDGVLLLPDLHPACVVLQCVNATSSRRTCTFLPVHGNLVGRVRMKCRNLWHGHVEDLRPEQLGRVELRHPALADRLANLRRVYDLLFHRADVRALVHEAVLRELRGILPEVRVARALGGSPAPRQSPGLEELGARRREPRGADLSRELGRQGVQNPALRAVLVQRRVDIHASLQVGVHPLQRRHRVVSVHVEDAGRRERARALPGAAGHHLRVHGDLARGRDVVVPRQDVQQLPAVEALHLSEVGLGQDRGTPPDAVEKVKCVHPRLAPGKALVRISDAQEVEEEHFGDEALHWAQIHGQREKCNPKAKTSEGPRRAVPLGGSLLGAARHGNTWGRCL